MMQAATQSPEFEIEREREKLIRKLVNRQASDDDRARLEALWLRRAELMQSATLRRLEQLKRSHSRKAG
jgi:hypothetical protein